MRLRPVCQHTDASGRELRYDASAACALTRPLRLSRPHGRYDHWSRSAVHAEATRRDARRMGRGRERGTRSATRCGWPRSAARCSSARSYCSCSRRVMRGVHRARSRRSRRVGATPSHCFAPSSRRRDDSRPRIRRSAARRALAERPVYVPPPDTLSAAASARRDFTRGSERRAHSASRSRRELAAPTVVSRARGISRAAR